LFQPFVTTKSQGMGIGLSLCRTIIESHGGQIKVDANPTGGTIFHFTIRAALEADND
jgi:two-component system sensor kinase FixL